MIRIISIGLFFVVISTVSADSNEYIWQNGNRQSKVYLNPDFIAENEGSFGLHGEKKFQIKKVSDAKLKSILSKGLLPKNLVNTHLEVFEEVPGGRKMVLTGSIFVEFVKDWDEAKVKEWSATQNLTLVGKVNSSRNLYTFQSSTGIKSLHLANRLLTQAGIQVAFPNWWRESVGK